MKDIQPRYDPIVGELLGFNPNSPFSYQEEQDDFSLRLAPSDITLEFARRMRNILSENDSCRYEINPNHLLTMVERGDTITRTYYNYRKGRSAREQQFPRNQEITFKKDPKGSYGIIGIYFLTDKRALTWKEASIHIGEEAIVIEAKNHVPVINLKVVYPTANTDGPFVYLNGAREPEVPCTPNSELESGYLTFEHYPSSAIVPAQFQELQFATHMRLNSDLMQTPGNPELTSDKHRNNLLDILVGTRMQWAP